MSKEIKYTENRPLHRIKMEVMRSGGWWNSDKYENEGSDWQTFEFHHPSIKRVQVVYGLNGKFIVKLPDGNIVTESSSEMDKVPWYRALLDLLYVREKKAA